MQQRRANGRIQQIRNRNISHQNYTLDGLNSWYNPIHNPRYVKVCWQLASFLKDCIHRSLLVEGLAHATARKLLCINAAVGIKPLLLQISISETLAFGPLAWPVNIWLRAPTHAHDASKSLCLRPWACKFTTTLYLKQRLGDWPNHLYNVEPLSSPLDCRFWSPQLTNAVWD